MRLCDDVVVIAAGGESRSSELGLLDMASEDEGCGTVGLSVGGNDASVDGSGKFKYCCAKDARAR